MSYNNFYALRSSPTLLARFVVAVEITAVTIWTESETAANHAARVGWAQRALFATDKVQGYASLMLRVASATDASFQSSGETTTDAYIQSLVSAYANQLSLANY